MRLRANSGPPRAARASYSTPCGGQRSGGPPGGTGRPASGLRSTRRMTSSITLRKSSGSAAARRHHQHRKDQAARGRDFLEPARQSGKIGLRAGAGAAAPRIRRASSRPRPSRVRRRKTSHRTDWPTARSARRGHRGPARGSRSPAPAPPASQVEVFARPSSRSPPAPRAPPSRSEGDTAKLAPSPPNTNGNSRPSSALVTAAITAAPAMLTAL